MKSNTGKYDTVTTLPAGAISVKDYAEQKGITTAWIYRQVSHGKNKDFKIVIYQSFNFVVPLKT